MRTGVYVAIIVLFSLVAGIYLANYLRENRNVIQIPTQNACSVDSECEWRITNCCPESAGAKWNCESGKNKMQECPKSIICPQVLSPKPDRRCVCVQGRCESI